MTLLFGSGNFLTMERDRANVTEYCAMPQKCNIYGFSDWYKVGKVCVKYFNRPRNFTDAEFDCRARAPGAHLVSVHSKQNNDYLLCIVKKFQPNKLRIWLGAFELFKSGQFLWLDGSFWNYQIWTRGEPNHMYTSTEECVEMNWKEIGKWNDASCNVKKRYICAFRVNDILKPGSEKEE
ncbi:lectin-like isoform X2 [Puntigrus tetrazona]|uniref:lectin-like isoform X2 n=1 Tax=Puntigrus tetrazona TaxID=1606681 RepID=UPI001C8941A9|nr:lectin-like isoform X2 [Puntigrus tetrazona]